MVRARIGFALTITAIFLALLVFLALAPVSVASRSDMTAWSWICDLAGFFFGAYVGQSLLFVIRGGSPVWNHQWDMRRYRPITSVLGKALAVAWVITVALFFANGAATYALRNPWR